MKTIILFISIVTSFFCQAQGLTDIRFKKEYKTISIAEARPQKPNILTDTVRLVDTVYVDDTVPITQQETFDFTPQISDVFSPLDRLVITSNYGMRLHPIKRRWLFHSGVDFSAYKDTVRSVLNGKVHSSGYENGLGYYVKVEHNNYVVTYAHLSQYFLLRDTPVKAGQPIGITGSTGLSTGEHLHFSVHYDGSPVDPIQFLNSLIKLKTTLALNVYENREHQTIRN